MMSKKSKITCIAVAGVAVIVLAVVAFLMLRDNNKVDPEAVSIAWVTTLRDEEKAIALEDVFQAALESSGYSDEFEDAAVFVHILTPDYTLDPSIGFAVPDYQMMLVDRWRGDSYLKNESVDIMVDLSDSQALLDIGVEDHCVCLIDWESADKAPEGYTNKLLAILEELH